MNSEQHNQFNAGDIVCLKSSPSAKMTIQSINDDGTCTCVWTDKSNRPHQQDYLTILLQKYKMPTIRNISNRW